MQRPSAPSLYHHLEKSFESLFKLYYTFLYLYHHCIGWRASLEGQWLRDSPETEAERFTRDTEVGDSQEMQRPIGSHETERHRASSETQQR
ncbi:hypothetical protein F2Q69_00030135 [Brassica cretica]|uniref:Uncharacterized protein n=1 Tax=Brassica cretica TaxID=69181 RepID=A0A8S9RUT1_BRACR|nr:hypothetical protein F2Q69_00030135 [Brassica cretica]